MQSNATLPVIGMDIAKNVFQLHVVDAETGELERHKLRRDRVTTFFANRQRSLVALEACGGAHHWARTLQAFGHEVNCCQPNMSAPLSCVTRPMPVMPRPSGWQPSNLTSRPCRSRTSSSKLV